MFQSVIRAYKASASRFVAGQIGNNTRVVLYLMLYLILYQPSSQRFSNVYNLDREDMFVRC
jgi:hypothetical protein